MSLRPLLHVASLQPRPDRSVQPAVQQNISVESNALLRGTREILIRHGGEVYRLRHTRNDKLILTK
ncbi:MAG TPA: hemin uptake protein HemP [Lysobacter sp.]